MELTLNLPTYQVCPNKLTQHGCNTEEAVRTDLLALIFFRYHSPSEIPNDKYQVTTMKDSQLIRVHKDIGRSVADFDSCKCPAVK